MQVVIIFLYNTCVLTVVLSRIVFWGASHGSMPSSSGEVKYVFF